MTTPEVTIPAFEATSIQEIMPIHSKLWKTFRSSKTKDIEYRLVQLRRLYWGIKDNVPLMQAALYKDMRKSAFESMITEIDWILQDCLHTIKNLKSWAKDEKYSDVPIEFRVLNARIRKEPLGVALIIGAYNFPFMIGLGPVVGAIAAGCPAVIKPSEVSPSTAMIIAKIVRECLDPEAYAVVNGALPEVTALLELKWDKILYTGSGTVGTIIAKKAAETLTPVTLELGGKNPAFVTRQADLHLAARRLMWGKTVNAGQVCISHNYVLVDRAVLSPFIQELKKTCDDFFPNGAKNSPDLARVINKRHFLRMKKMIDESHGKIVMGGDMDEDVLYIEPTAIQVDSATDSMMVEESFGPLFAIMPYTSLEEAITTMNEVDPTPLGLYVFGSKQEQDQILTNCLSGGASMNDSFFHGSVLTLPFGGVGSSGMGSWHGKASFDAFTHHRTVTTTPGWIDRLVRVRYMPYSIKEYKRLTATHAKPNFDRSGRVVAGGLAYWIRFVLGLGGRGAKVDGHKVPVDETSIVYQRTTESERQGVGSEHQSRRRVSQQTNGHLSRATTAAA